ncbi:Copia type Polyprotein [Phytophthora megakarya]|uniref:Copia type Polyprotein n=1 Tax=Phytophthora megakarya TaxID=4795 RepID=A0A225UJB6_9STRA|nr:Copia type Polyprotein [Phytophthora megakarya]
MPTGKLPRYLEACIRIHNANGWWINSVSFPSTSEAEYAVACETCQEGKHIKNILMEIVGNRKVAFTLGVDNQAAIALATHPTYSRETRHIELRLHFVRE